MTDPTKNLVERLLSGKPTPLEREAGEALASLADELRLAREDAARYRWLRHADDQDWNELMRDGGEQLDIAIDKAMKEPR